MTSKPKRKPRLIDDVREPDLEDLRPPQLRDLDELEDRRHRADSDRFHDAGHMGFMGPDE